MLQPLRTLLRPERDLDAGLNLKRPGFTNNAGGRLASRDNGVAGAGAAAAAQQRGDAQRRGQESQSQACDAVRVAAARRLRVAISNGRDCLPMVRSSYSPPDAHGC